MKPFFKFIVIVSIIPLLIGLYFFDNIKGYYRFKQYCEKEAGFKSYQKLDRDHGWLVDELGDPMAIAYLEGVKFARYKDYLTEKYFDMKYVSGDPHKKGSFSIVESNLNEDVKYRWVNVSHFIGGEERLSKFGNELIDNEGNKILGVYEFSYAKFDRKYTPLDMNPVSRCPWQYKSQREAFSAWAEKMNITTFIFEAFDEPWKGDDNNPLGAEKHWGLFTVDRKPKLVMRDLYPDLMAN